MSNERLQHEDFQWFLKNYNDLYQKYGHSYLAIKNAKVLGAYNSYAEGVRATMPFEELGSFIVQECGPDESAYTRRIVSLFAVPKAEEAV